MTVRRWLLETAAVDVLTEMNDRLRRYSRRICVCSAIFDFDRKSRCECFEKNCNLCIQSLLNEHK